MNSTNKLLLEAKGITKYFGTITALENVNLKVHSGECLGVVGDNGAGKSTLMKVLSGLYKPSNGALFFEGKEKILERPLFGHGIFSSRDFGDKYKIINHENKMLSAIPLHPHNSILQLWLELGIFGVGLFYIFICIIINRIYQVKKINRQYAAFSLASLFQIFLIGQFSYGFWQIWWISVIFFSIFIYNVLYKKLLQIRKS